MDMRSLIPFGRNRTIPSPLSTDEVSPFLALHRQMNRLFDDVWRDFDSPMLARDGWSMRWPQIDVSETEKAVEVRAELPGLTEKEVEVTLRDGALTLKGEKKLEHKDVVHSELWHGSFERLFPVGDVDPDKVNAEFKNGVLTVPMEKRPEAQSNARRIPINGH